jgi:hypothetical protein
LPRRERSAWITLEHSLSQGLAGRLDYHAEYIDLARFPDASYQVALRDFIRAKYASYQFDLIIATSTAPLDFVTRYRDELFPGTPLVYSAGPGAPAVANATGVTSDVNLSDSLQIAVTIQPGTQRVVVVRGASAFDKYYEALARQQFSPFEGKLRFTYLRGWRCRNCSARWPICRRIPSFTF